MNSNKATLPVLPRPLSFPLKIMPASISSAVLVSVLNQIFSQALKDGELDFLQQRFISVQVEDAGLEFCLTLAQGKLVSCRDKQSTDLSLKGTVYNFLLLATRREDTDTLFFSRRLGMQGDTELGLEVKNFLDSFDVEEGRLSRHIDRLLQKTVPIYERLFG